MNKSSATHAVPTPAIGRPEPLAPAVAIVGVGAAVIAVVRTAVVVAAVVRGGERAADDGAGRKAAEERSAAPVVAPARLRLLRDRDRRNGHRRGCRESCHGLRHRRYLT